MQGINHYAKQRVTVKLFAGRPSAWWKSFLGRIPECHFTGKTPCHCEIQSVWQNTLAHHRM